MDLPGFTAFDKSKPEACYLGDPQGDFAGLADATIVANGYELPVHSHVLSLHSRVLRTVFATIRNEDNEGCYRVRAWTAAQGGYGVSR